MDGGTVYQRRPLQQGYIRGYDSQQFRDGHCPVYSLEMDCPVYSLEVDIVQYTVYRWTLSSLQVTDEHCPVYSLEMDIVQYTV